VSRSLAGLATLIRDAANAVSADVPGIERISGWEENLLSGVADLAHLRASFANDPSDDFIEKLRTRTLLEATESARYLGAWRCANLERFFREIGVELDGGRSPHALLRRLRVAVATEKMAEEGRPADLMADAVRVMTIHGAKGLGFDHVYLMQLHKGIGGGSKSQTAAAELAGKFEYRLLGVPTLAWDCVLRERDRTSEAERVRLLYVAMTRAKQRLVLTGLWSNHQQRSGRGQAIEFIQPRIESTRGLADWISGAAREGTSEFVDRYGTRWSLPVLETGEEQASSNTPAHDTDLPSEFEVAEASRKLIALRQSASTRMLRPMRAMASAEDHDDGEDDDRERREGATSGGMGVDARAIGSAIHRTLELFDFSVDEEVEIEHQRDALVRNLEQKAKSDHAESTVTAGTQLWDQIARGSLFARLRKLSDRIIARELSVLSPPIDEEGPVGYFTGLIDLVYRDPSNDQMVIVDYKTGAVGDREVLRSPKESYIEQGDAYKRALKSAFELSYTPRFELWLLRDDEIIRY
jgi:ATP-dependent exoDNAse (exonuclease V) beta subunit